MNKLVLFAAAALAFAGLTSCHDDDPRPINEVPVVPAAPNTVSGIVTNLDGEPIANAVVKIGSYTTTTDSEGRYEISGIAPGEYEAEISAPGMVTSTTTIVVDNSSNTQNVFWSVSLPRENSKTVNVTVDEGGQGEVESDAIKGNTEGEIKMEVDVPANTVPENTTIVITPIYTEESAMIQGRAADEILLIGADINCSDPDLVLSNPINVSFNVDQTVVSGVETRQLINGQWVTVEHSTTTNGVVVPTKTFSPIGLFFRVNITQTNTKDNLTFTTAKWDNLYGTSSVRIGDATFSYKVGSDYNTRGANSLEGLLIEYIARLVGPTSRTLQGTYPINLTLLPGQALEIFGTQDVENISVAGNSTTVTAKKYGTVTVRTVGTNRDHNGSGS
ncbi:MAG: carboxypeptidase-like regulatory domain-containing protein [Firmicutes bacterium]|nr:carboxypeptidase-like regulatory domain-containing protein [Bacillota bacterium]MCM1401955.1 carboxypeptidase-like regulatory domain-containing protein [Bacteroides sp.]MCM1477903.1 carboxypeptidase-like regulatory domain-containing protein [Bacteroides sp.]